MWPAVSCQGWTSAARAPECSWCTEVATTVRRGRRWRRTWWRTAVRWRSIFAATGTRRPILEHPSSTGVISARWWPLWDGIGRYWWGIPPADTPSRQRRRPELSIRRRCAWSTASCSMIVRQRSAATRNGVNPKRLNSYGRCSLRMARRRTPDARHNLPMTRPADLAAIIVDLVHQVTTATERPRRERPIDETKCRQSPRPGVPGGRRRSGPLRDRRGR